MKQTLERSLGLVLGMESLVPGEKSLEQAEARR